MAKMKVVKGLTKESRTFNGERYTYLVDRGTEVAAHRAIAILHTLGFKARTIPYKGRFRMTYWRVYYRRTPKSKLDPTQYRRLYDFAKSA